MYKVINMGKKYSYRMSINFLMFNFNEHICHEKIYIRSHLSHLESYLIYRNTSKSINNLLEQRKLPRMSFKWTGLQSSMGIFFFNFKYI